MKTLAAGKGPVEAARFSRVLVGLLAFLVLVSVVSLWKSIQFSCLPCGRSQPQWHWAAAGLLLYTGLFIALLAKRLPPHWLTSGLFSASVVHGFLIVRMVLLEPGRLCPLCLAAGVGCGITLGLAALRHKVQVAPLLMGATVSLIVVVGLRSIPDLPPRLSHLRGIPSEFFSGHPGVVTVLSVAGRSAVGDSSLNPDHRSRLLNEFGTKIRVESIQLDAVRVRPVLVLGYRKDQLRVFEGAPEYPALRNMVIRLAKGH